MSPSGSAGGCSPDGRLVMGELQPWLQDPDVTLYHGDALEKLRQLPDGSVDMVATSPPFYGLRDYGTGEWEKKPCLFPLPDGRRCLECATCQSYNCDHKLPPAKLSDKSTLGIYADGRSFYGSDFDPAKQRSITEGRSLAYGKTCGKC